MGGTGPRGQPCAAAAPPKRRGRIAPSGLRTCWGLVSPRFHPGLACAAPSGLRPVRVPFGPNGGVRSQVPEGRREVATGGARASKTPGAQPVVPTQEVVSPRMGRATEAMRLDSSSQHGFRRPFRGGIALGAVPRVALRPTGVGLRFTRGYFPSPLRGDRRSPCRSLPTSPTENANPYVRRRLGSDRARAVAFAVRAPPQMAARARETRTAICVYPCSSVVNQSS